MCLAIPGQVLEDSSEDAKQNNLAKVSFGGIIKIINMSFLPEARPGDYIIAHVGFAISILNSEEAEKTLKLLRPDGESK